jgi:membrane protein YdbS with pleckstrin-like domain
MRVPGEIVLVVSGAVALAGLVRVVRLAARYSTGPEPALGRPLMVHGMACLVCAVLVVAALDLPLLAELPIAYLLTSWGASAVFFGRTYARRGDHPRRVITAHPHDREHPPMDLHPGEDVVFEGHPSWRALLSFYIGGVAAAAAIGVVVALLTSVFTGLLVGAALVAAVLAFGLFKRTATTYLVSNQRLYIRRGLLAKRVQQTRIDRVQNVNTEQSLRERVLRVGTVDFDTAGSDDSEFRFVGIADPASVVAAVDRAQREATPI